MATLADLIKWRDALLRARFAGTRKVETEGHTVEYKSDSEMASALAELERRIDAASGATRITTIRISSSKGL